MTATSDCSADDVDDDDDDDVERSCFEENRSLTVEN